MTEGLIKRIGRLVSASANSLVDAVENSAPDLVMEQAIREIDQAILDVRQQLGKVEASKYLSSKALNEDNIRHAELTDQISIAVKAGRDDLAEAAIAKQMDLEAMMPVVEKSLAEADDELKELNAYITALGAKKREMEDRLAEFKKATVSNVNPDSTAASTSDSVSSRVEQATGTFNRMMRNQGAPGISDPNSQQLIELEELSRKNRIQERLARIKSQPED